VRHVVGVDVGGTFTDVLLMPLDGSRSVLAKVPSTADPAEGVVQGVLEAARRATVEPDDIELILNGTTIVTNTVVERRGARVGALVTRGFRYVLEIARSWTPGPVSGWMVWEKPAPLADVRDIREVGGRIDARGGLLEPFDEPEIRVAVRALAERGIEALTVSLFNGYLRPDLEARVGEIAHEEAPGLPITLGSAVLPEFREYERTLVAVANAYVQPAMRRYVEALEAELKRSFPRATVNIVRSDGGLMSGADAAARPIESVFSGPAGGLRAAVFLGELIGRRDVLSFDMGGTSTDVALNSGGHAAVSRRSSLTDYYKVRVPSLDVVAIGAGGGSIAHVPITGALRVGPESAGSLPGPACYGRGGEEPTVTDANAVLGHLPSLLGGSMELRRDLAERAVERVAGPLDLSIEDAARAVVDVVNDRMLGGLRLVSIQRGHDPRTFTLVAFGGAGPLHANALLELLESPLCAIPPAPGIFSTFGFLAADVQREFSRSHIRRVSTVTRGDLEAIVDELAGQARCWLQAEGFEDGDQRLVWQFGMRYFRQGYELPVIHADPAADPDLPATLAARFAEAHRRFYQFDLEVEPELVVVRCIATGIKPRPEVRAREEATEPVEAAVTDSEHVIYWRGGWVQASVYARERLQPGHELPGPAVVEQEDSTTLIHPGFRARVDRFLNLILERA
jgi:N-methylhydantoinase A